MLRELAEPKPLLFILEDLHWMDPTSLALLDLCIDQAPTAPILTLLTCRPTFHPLESPRLPAQILLNRLPRHCIEQMAPGVAGGRTLPAEVLQHIVEKTDGIPLFVEEITKALLESGHLQETHEHYELTGPLSAVAIPSTLHDSLMARLDRLITAKAVAQYAAGIGRHFSYALLQAVSQLDEATLQHELDTLVEAELIYQQGVPPQASYMFKHALIQEAAYQSLLRRTQQQYQLRIAQVLAERFPETAETQPELLAHHYTEAGLGEQAVGYWQRAGQRALERSAYVEGISHLGMGLHLLKALPETTERIRTRTHHAAGFGPSATRDQRICSAGSRSRLHPARELCQQGVQSPQLFPCFSASGNFMCYEGICRWPVNSGSSSSPWRNTSKTRRTCWRPTGRWRSPASRWARWPPPGRTRNAVLASITPSSTMPLPSCTGKTLGHPVWPMPPWLSGTLAIRTRPCSGVTRCFAWLMSCRTPSAWRTPSTLLPCCISTVGRCKRPESVLTP